MLFLNHSVEFSGICLKPVMSSPLIPVEDRDCRAKDRVPEMISSLICVSLWRLRLQGVFQALHKHSHLTLVLCFAGAWLPSRFGAMKLLGLNPDFPADQRMNCVAISSVIGTNGEDASRLTASHENQVHWCHIV